MMILPGVVHNSRIHRHLNPKLKWFWSRLAVASAQSIELRGYVDNEDVVEAAPTGDAPTTSEYINDYIA